MSKKYKNPPIVEAVCEFRLTSDTAWDLTIPGLIYGKIKGEFPHREQRLVHEIEISHGPEGMQHQVRAHERVFFFADDRKKFVQLGPRLLAVNCLKPYPTWQEFKPKIEKAFKALTEIVNVKGIQRIGLRYINQIEIPGAPIKLENYFEFYPFVGPRLPQNMEGFTAISEFPYANGRDLCRVQLAPAPSKPERPLITLDIDYFLRRPKGVEPESTLVWVEEAHSRVEEIFEGCVTDRLRQQFQEVK